MTQHSKLQRQAIPPAISVAEAVLWLRRAALGMDPADAGLFRGFASFLQSTIPALEKKQQQAGRQ